MAKRQSFCPFSNDGCKPQGSVCRFWGDRKGCDIQNGINAVKSLPNLLKRLENKLEEGAHIKEKAD